jgi:hypothetical protein
MELINPINSSQMIKYIDDILAKNPNKFKIFLDMVDEVNDGAQGYYETIAVPMYLNLIKNRLKNDYYLTKSALSYDFKLIETNSTKSAKTR